MAMIPWWADGNNLRSYSQIHDLMVYGFELSWHPIAYEGGFDFLSDIGESIEVIMRRGIGNINTIFSLLNQFLDTCARDEDEDEEEGDEQPRRISGDTCEVGTPVEPRAHPANQHAATWIAGEARPASFPSSYLNATPSGSASGKAAARTRACTLLR
ncbi:hypothetical protein NL676_000462 [Syzygium grande]|nr:hypothetical protein NL676_000462 [Syzygium grande]